MKLAECSYSLGQRLHQQKDFKEAVREERIMRYSDYLSDVDMSFLDIVKEGGNEQARVAAGRELLKRWDDNYKDTKHHDITHTFLDLVRAVDEEEKA